MSDIKSNQISKVSTEKSSTTIKRKLDTADPDILNVGEEVKATKSEFKKRKSLPSIHKQEKQCDDAKKVIEKSEQSNAMNKLAEDDFKKHPDLHLSYKLIYEPCGVPCLSKPKQEPESEEYGAFEFSLDKIRIKFRVAKTTPTKVGQFVTLWKRIENGPIMPYDANDPIDIFVICVREGRNFGQFVFSKNILVSEKVLSKAGKGGKRAIRIYAPWVKTTSPQATNTQSWQTRYFINLSDTKKIDLERVRRLYGFK